jgi:hypothetical protein
MNTACEVTSLQDPAYRTEFDIKALGCRAGTQGSGHSGSKRSRRFRQNIGSALVDEIVTADAKKIGKPRVQTLEAFVAIDECEPDSRVVVESIEFELRVRHLTVAVAVGKGRTRNSGSALGTSLEKRNCPASLCRSMGSGGKRRAFDGGSVTELQLVRSGYHGLTLPLQRKLACSPNSLSKRSASLS